MYTIPASQNDTIYGYLFIRSFVINLALSVGCAALQITTAIRDYRAALRAGRLRREVIEFLFFVSVISAGITLITAVLGPYRGAISAAIVIFLNLGIAGGMNIFGVFYDFTDLIVSNPRSSAFRKIGVY